MNPIVIGGHSGAKNDPSEFCNKFDLWAQLMAGHGDGISATFDQAWPIVRASIAKSCLLDRMVYGGEMPSKTPCPVHQGRWSGIQLGHPGRFWSDGSPVKEEEHLRKAYDDGCRCWQHKSCSCTTGWQPDAACGCVVDG